MYSSYGFAASRVSPAFQQLMTGLVGFKTSTEATAAGILARRRSPEFVILKDGHNSQIHARIGGGGPALRGHKIKWDSPVAGASHAAAGRRASLPGLRTPARHSPSVVAARCLTFTADCLSAMRHAALAAGAPASVTQLRRCVVNALRSAEEFQELSSEYGSDFRDFVTSLDVMLELVESTGAHGSDFSSVVRALESLVSCRAAMPTAQALTDMLRGTFGVSPTGAGAMCVMGLVAFDLLRVRDVFGLWGVCDVGDQCLSELCL